MYYVSLIVAVPIAIAFAITGRGVSYDTGFDLMRALKSAAGGGVAGAAAMVLQVLTLMPLRTIMNYQYRYGGGFTSSTKKLWNDGGFRRYYAGLGAALYVNLSHLLMEDSKARYLALEIPPPMRALSLYWLVCNGQCSSRPSLEVLPVPLSE